MEDLAVIPDFVLVERLLKHVHEERERLHSFIAWLGELDRRGEHIRQLGYASTFEFCVAHLGLSEDEAFRRIRAARAAVIRPQILSAMSEGKLTLTAVSRLAPHVRRHDAPQIISRAEGRSSRELEELLAPLTLEPHRRDSVRAVAVSPEHVRVDFHFQGSVELRKALDRARELLSHVHPGGGLEDVLLTVLDEYLRRNDPMLVEAGRASAAPGGARVPAAVRRAVWRRDGGRCRYVGVTGMRCESRIFLEIDHILPRAKGGGDVEGNLRLLCRAHNDSERRRILGEGD